jgi:RimJ/RimL family protein N-acetyltransferase
VNTVGEAHYFDGSDVVKGRCFSIEALEGPHVGTVIGMINTNDIEVAHRSTEIDVVIGHSQYRERGYGTDAIREFLRFLFDTVGLHRVWLSTYEYNARARHVYEKLGFQQEGIMRETDFVDARWINAVVYGILEEEFRRGKPCLRGTLGRTIDDPDIRLRKASTFQAQRVAGSSPVPFQPPLLALS